MSNRTRRHSTTCVFRPAASNFTLNLREHVPIGAKDLRVDLKRVVIDKLFVNSTKKDTLFVYRRFNTIDDGDDTKMINPTAASGDAVSTFYVDAATNDDSLQIVTIPSGLSSIQTVVTELNAQLLRSGEKFLRFVYNNDLKRVTMRVGLQKNTVCDFDFQWHYGLDGSSPFECAKKPLFSGRAKSKFLQLDLQAWFGSQLDANGNRVFENATFSKVEAKVLANNGVNQSLLALVNKAKGDNGRGLLCNINGKRNRIVDVVDTGIIIEVELDKAADKIPIKLLKNAYREEIDANVCRNLLYKFPTQNEIDFMFRQEYPQLQGRGNVLDCLGFEFHKKGQLLIKTDCTVATFKQLNGVSTRDNDRDLINTFSVNSVELTTGAIAPPPLYVKPNSSLLRHNNGNIFLYVIPDIYESLGVGLKNKITVVEVAATHQPHATGVWDQQRIAFQIMCNYPSAHKLKVHTDIAERQNKNGYEAVETKTNRMQSIASVVRTNGHVHFLYEPIFLNKNDVQRTKRIKCQLKSRDGTHIVPFHGQVEIAYAFSYTI